MDGCIAGPHSITALSEGRGYGEAGGEGLFTSCQISDYAKQIPLPHAGSE